MKLGVIAAALAGLAVVAWLVLHIGFAAVVSAIASVGWSGFAILCAYALMLFAVLGTAWFSLIADLPPSRIATFVWGRIVRDAAGEVLPFSQFGGILIGVRALVLRGVATPMAFASTIVDVTTEMVAQIVFIFVGISLFVLRFGMGGRTNNLPFAVIAGIVLAIAGSIAFVVLQRRGLGLAEKLATQFLPGAVKHAQSLGRDIETIYETPGRLAASCAIHICAWFASAIGTWLAIRLIGGNVSIAGAIAIESILSALRSTAVVVPGALGIQEAGYALMLPLFGLPAEMGLAVSLLKRAREIAIGAPVLLMWQGLEGRRALTAPEA
jgi:putative membrane protein